MLLVRLSWCSYKDVLKIPPSPVNIKQHGLIFPLVQAANEPRITRRIPHMHHLSLDGELIRSRCQVLWITRRQMIITCQGLPG